MIKNSKNLFDVLEADILETGFIGDTSIPKLVWLASHTRKLGNPVSLVIQGPSGSGKSFALKTGLMFIPDDDYEIFHGMSEKALIYSDDLDLKHKHLIIQEAAGLAEGNGRTFLRQVLSEGEAKYRTVESIDGSLGSKELHIEGPMGLMMTTTASQIHPEDASRMLSVSIVECDDHIGAILMAQAIGTRKKLSTQRLDEWKTFSKQALKKDIDVEIPFAAMLADKLPRSHFRIQRDFQQVLSLIKASALLHRCNRERRENGAVIASLTDYKIVYELVSEALSEGLELSVPYSVREVIDAVDELSSLPRKQFEKVTQARIASHLERDRSVVSRNVSKAIESGYLVNDNPGQGREADLRIGQEKLGANRKILPHPSELKDRT